MDEAFGPAALAIFGGELDELRSLLALEPDLATRRSSVSHPTLLQFVACDAEHMPDPVGAATALLDAGADPAAPLVAAAGCGSVSVMECLLERGADIDGASAHGATSSWSALDEAVYWVQPDVIASLLARGALIRALSTAAGLGDLVRTREFCDGDPLAPGAGPIGSPFADTVPADLADDPQSILDHGFVMAINAGQRATAEFLLRAGAEVNARPPGYHWQGTALHAACWRGDRDVVAWLMSVGADPKIRDGMVDSDAAGWAAYHGNGHLSDLLAG